MMHNLLVPLVLPLAMHEFLNKERRYYFLGDRFTRGNAGVQTLLQTAGDIILARNGDNVLV